MTDELRNRTWAVLPEEFKREVREIHKHYSNTYNAYQEGAFNAIKMIFGLHNLTAEEQPKPKFEVGDKVIVNGKFISAIYDIDTKNYPDCPYYIRKLDGYYAILPSLTSNSTLNPKKLQTRIPRPKSVRILRIQSQN